MTLRSTLHLAVLGLSGGFAFQAAADPTLAARESAAEATASSTSNICDAARPFYWEVGNAGGMIDNASVGLLAPTGSTQMDIASASKLLFATYAVQALGVPLSAADLQYLELQSGYDNQNDALCLLSTVNGCFTAAHLDGTANNTQSNVGDFYYGGGSFQALAVQLGLGGDGVAKLATDMRNVLGTDVSFSYTSSDVAGGAHTSASNYGYFLRKLLNGDYLMSSLLGTSEVCTQTPAPPASQYVDPVCPGGSNSLYSPVTAAGVTDQSWHYSVGHWVEDWVTTDSANHLPQGDGAFSDPGLYGFYPWIDSSKTWYGIVARHDTTMGSDPSKYPYWVSAQCGAAIRKAWATGVAQ